MAIQDERSESNTASGSQPPPLPPMSEPAQQTTSQRQEGFGNKIGYALRLLGKEISRAKTKRFNLRSAYYQLGSAAYQRQVVPPNEAGIAKKLDELNTRLEQLSLILPTGSTFKEQLKVNVRRLSNMMKRLLLRSRRKRLLRKLGGRMAKAQELSDALPVEFDRVKALSHKLESIEQEMVALAARTYFWARRPLATLSVVLVVFLLSFILLDKRLVAANQGQTPAKSEGYYNKQDAHGDEAKARFVSAEATPEPSESPSATPNERQLAEFLALFGISPSPQPQAAGRDSSSEPSRSSAAPNSAQASSKRDRTEDSRAAERYIRRNLIGGLTENQIIALSDAIAQEFEAGGAAEALQLFCISGGGDKKEISVYRIRQMAASSGSSPQTVAAQTVLSDIHNMIPPRAVFQEAFYDGENSVVPPPRPLSPTEAPIGRVRAPGSLSEEHLQSFKDAIYNLVNLMPPDKRKETNLGYWNKVEGLAAGDVLRCLYQDPRPGFDGRPFYYWYKAPPAGLDELLNKLPPDHPIRQIGPSRESAPATYELALQANAESARTVKANDEWEKAHHAAEPTPSNWDKLAGFFKPFADAGATFGMHQRKIEDEQRTQHQERVRKLIAESGGAKIECPKCRGEGKIVTYTPVYGTNPHSLSDHRTWDPSADANFTHSVDCDRCGGLGVVNK